MIERANTSFSDDGEGNAIQIALICVGKLKEKYWQLACDEYQKRMRSYWPIDITVVKDEPVTENPNTAEQDRVLQREAERILGQLRERDHVVALAIQGKTYTSESFASHLSHIEQGSHGRLVFVIGGTLGLHQEVYRRAGERLSFSTFTFPHQMMRCILLEQLYRAMRLNQGAPYHR